MDWACSLAQAFDLLKGSECDEVIISCVRSNVNDKENTARANIGFLTDANRLNVALTRAKYALYIVGNFRVLQVSQSDDI